MAAVSLHSQNHKTNGSHVLANTSMETVSALAVTGIVENPTVPTGIAGWNLYKLWSTWKNLSEELRNYEVARGELRYPVVLIADPMLIRREHTRIRSLPRRLRALEESIRRCYYTLPAYGMRVIRIGALFLRTVPMKKGFEGLCDASAYSIFLMHHIATENPELIREPMRKTYKDVAYRTFKIFVAAMSAAAGIFAITHSMGYIEEDSTYYQTANKAVMAVTVLDAGYSALQLFDLVAPRE